MIALVWTALAFGAGPNEVYGVTGADVHLSSRQLAGGAGGGVGYRRHDLPAQLRASMEFRVGIFAAPTVGLGLGLERGLVSHGRWELAVGVEALALFGKIWLLSEEQPVPIRGPAVSVRLTLRPAVIHLDDCDVSFAELSYGRGLEDVLDSHAAGFDLLAIGCRFGARPG